MPRGLRFIAAARDDGGTVTAEFTVVVPAVLVVLALTIGGIFIAAHRVSLVALAAEVARLEARGDDDLARAALARAAGTQTVRRDRAGGLHCVAVSATPGSGPLAGIGIGARACAAVSGEGSDAR